MMCFTFKTTELFLQPRALPLLSAGADFRTPQVTSCRDAVQDAGEMTWRVRSWQKDEKHHLILKVRSISICQPPVAGLSRPTTEWDLKCCFNTEFVVPLLWVMHGPAQRKYPKGPPLFHLSEVGRMRTFLLQMPCCPRSWGSGAQTQVRGFQARRSKWPVTALSARCPLSPRGKDHSWHLLEPKVLEHSFFFKPAPKGGSKQKGKVGNTYVQPLTHVLLCSVPRPAPLLPCHGNGTRANILQKQEWVRISPSALAGSRRGGSSLLGLTWAWSSTWTLHFMGSDVLFIGGF